MMRYPTSRSRKRGGISIHPSIQSILSNLIHCFQKKHNAFKKKRPFAMFHNILMPFINFFYHCHPLFTTLRTSSLSLSLSLLKKKELLEKTESTAEPAQAPSYTPSS